MVQRKTRKNMTQATAMPVRSDDDGDDSYN